MHWRRPYHHEQSLDNILYTICADNKIRVWAATDPHGLLVLQLWAEIDMNVSIQPRRQSISAGMSGRRYGFIIDSRDFSVATERAVQRGAGKEEENHALEHLIEIATRNPEICVVLDGRGHMSAWGLENVGCKARTASNVFNIAHVEGLSISFGQHNSSQEDYARFCTFSGGISADSFTLLVHYFDGRIEWYDSKVDELFDPTPRKKRLVPTATWSGHAGFVTKIVRSISGKAIISRTSDNDGLVWRQRITESGPVLYRQSSLESKRHIHRTCVMDQGKFVVNLHHESISLWDTRSFHAEELADCPYNLSGKPLCLLLLPSTELRARTAYVATISSHMKGIAWEVQFPADPGLASGKTEIQQPSMREFCTFDLGMSEDLSFVLPVDPAGSQETISGFFDVFAMDIALSYTTNGTLRTWTAKVDVEKSRVDWLLTATVETGIEGPSLTSGSSIRKTALVDKQKTGLTIWDTPGSQLEYEEHFAENDIIQDLDWTSTPDVQSILAVGFPHRVLLLSQLRYDYLNAGPAWASIREIQISDLTPHPIGDSCWLGNGNLVVGAGNQLFVYDKDFEINNSLVKNLRLPSHRMASMDLFDVVSRLNGPLPVFHPQFLTQCILSGKTNLVHEVLIGLHKKLKFLTDGDDIDGFLDIPLSDFFTETEVSLAADLLNDPANETDSFQSLVERNAILLC